MTNELPLFHSRPAPHASRVQPDETPGGAVIAGYTADNPLYRLLEQSLQDIGTVFGRLVYLASLRDSSTDSYRHPLLGKVLASNELNVVIRMAHRNIFYCWLGLGLRQQSGDLVRYLGSETPADIVAVRRLRDSGAFKGLAPEDAACHEKLLFEDDLLAAIDSALSQNRV